MRFFRKLIADKHSTGGIGDKVKKTCEVKHLLKYVDWSKINEEHSIVN